MSMAYPVGLGYSTGNKPSTDVIPLEELLKLDVGYEYFRDFAKSELCLENAMVRTSLI